MRRASSSILKETVSSAFLMRLSVRAHSWALVLIFEKPIVLKN
jgi:hypothetical protein